MKGNNFSLSCLLQARSGLSVGVPTEDTHHHYKARVMVTLTGLTNPTICRQVHLLSRLFERHEHREWIFRRVIFSTLLLDGIYLLSITICTAFLGVLCIFNRPLCFFLAATNSTQMGMILTINDRHDASEMSWTYEDSVLLLHKFGF